MKQALITIILIIGLVILPNLQQAVAAKDKLNLLNTVGILFVNDESDQFAGFCSCVKIKDTDLIVTANHCRIGTYYRVVFPTNISTNFFGFKGGDIAELAISGDRDIEGSDVAIFRIPNKYHKNGIGLADKEPQLGETITLYGYPITAGHNYGFDISMFVRQGLAAGVFNPENNDKGYQKFDVDLMKGLSGGAILNKDNRLVGITTAGFIGMNNLGIISVSPRLSLIKNLLEIAKK